ncbi:MAG: PSD1 and planctomycete cytochrome C domain-containing protein [Limisphaerales bacterium]
MAAPRHIVQIILLLCVLGSRLGAVDFEREILPLITEHCSECHGPDANRRKANLRLDCPPELLSEKERDVRSEVLRVDGELLARLTTDDADERMPPKGRLDASAVAKIRKWLEEGAGYARHWAFVPPRSPSVPKTDDWAQNEIDHLVWKRMQTAGLKPSPRAPRDNLIRRLSFDLTGLAPTITEIERFQSDRRPDAYERLVDRLLASDRLGERMAVDWMDVSRYADTSGYQYDWPRTMWRWRDWVIDAYNQNKPYNEFVVEQLAGDLLANPSLDQLVATGFNRNTPFTVETGSIDEEYRVNYVVDRVVTTGTAFMGLTLECARCHDHKYDPISQEEFYQLFAIFNNMREQGAVRGKPAAAEPAIASPFARQDEEIQLLQESLKRQWQRFHAPAPAVDQRQAAWEQSERTIWWKLFPVSVGGAPGARVSASYDRSIEVTDGRGPVSGIVANFKLPFTQGLTAIRLEGLPPRQGAPQVGMAALIEFEVLVGKEKKKLKNLTAALIPETPETLKAIDGDGTTGWVLPGPNPPTLVAYFDPPLSVKSTNELVQIKLQYAFRGPGHAFHRTRFSVTLEDASSRDRTGALLQFRSLPPARRSPQMLEELRVAYRANYEPEYERMFRGIRKAKARLRALQSGATMTMIMRDDQPRETFVLERGQYDRPGPKVTAGRPQILGGSNPQNRLELARWMTGPEHPLTARVAVNRVWQQLFGEGLVRTPEDFGTRGERPSHPELLDWLATDFVRHGWDVKRLIKQVCLSATYQQSSVISGPAHELDPANHWLARGSRFRLPAEMIRDHALSVGGLLNEPQFFAAARGLGQRMLTDPTFGSSANVRI